MMTGGGRLRAAGARKVVEFRYGGKVEVAYHEGPDGLRIEPIRTERA